MCRVSNLDWNIFLSKVVNAERKRKERFLTLASGLDPSLTNGLATWICLSKKIYSGQQTLKGIGPREFENQNETMKHVDLSSSRRTSGTDWQVLGELELPVGSECAGVIDTWMREKLRPVKLQTDITNRIVKSAQNAVERFMESKGAGAEFGHIHILVFAPLSHKSKEKTWGFFRIEKLESVREAKNPPDHYIEFHLYFEGE